MNELEVLNDESFDEDEYDFISFSQHEGGVSHSMTFPAEATLVEVVMNFKRFLCGCGYDQDSVDEFITLI